MGQLSWFEELYLWINQWTLWCYFRGGHQLVPNKVIIDEREVDGCYCRNCYNGWRFFKDWGEPRTCDPCGFTTAVDSTKKCPKCGDPI